MLPSEVLRALSVVLLVMVTVLSAAPSARAQTEQPDGPSPAGGDYTFDLFDDAAAVEALWDLSSQGHADGEPPTHGLNVAPDELLANIYHFHPHEPVRLPAVLTWSEDPLSSPNWSFQYHTLRWATSLARAWRDTGDQRYLDRYVALLQGWLERNPRSAPASPFSWNDNSTAWRAMTFADALLFLPDEPWLIDALKLHARTLAEDSFYVKRTNHALTQNIGLLAVGCSLGDRRWIDLARQRMVDLMAFSVDAQGVSTEQAVDYHASGLEHWTTARHELEDCGQPVPDAFRRLALMPRFLAYATLPNGEYVMLGDTERNPARLLPGTVAEYAATAGARGPQPDGVSAVFDAGYAFGRTGWGAERPFADEVAYSLRFGTRRFAHGHFDHTGVTLYGYGSRLLLDRGKYAYVDDGLRDYFRSPAAHNVVTVDGAAFDESERTMLSVFRHDATGDHVVVRHSAYPGVATQRRTVFSRDLGYLLVHDTLNADRPRRFRQLWHLPEDGDPQISGTTVTTRRPRGNVTLRQLAGVPDVAVRRGVSDPLQGWQSYRYGQAVKAPTVEVTQTGDEVIYLTLAVPSATGADVTVADVTARGNGFDALVTVGGRTEGVTVDGPRFRIVPVTTPFTDTYGSAFHGYIERLYSAGITEGRTTGLYGPGRPVTRGQMASFLVRTAHQLGHPLQDSDDARFDDVAGSVHAPAIRAVAAADITHGTGDGTTFEPDASVTRGQMASFLTRLLEVLGRPVPAPAEPRFTDMDGSVHTDAAEALGAAGIAHGTGDGTTFRPAVRLNRGQMAALLVRALDRFAPAGDEDLD